MPKVTLELSINGKSLQLDCYPMARLLDVIRQEAGLTGTKEGCGEGECGACAVSFNGKLVHSCIVPALQAQGAEIMTIEGLSPNGDEKGPLHPIQKAFLEFGGAQCGICTPGMILATYNLLQNNEHPNEAEIREGLAGNLCRCTGYIKIFEAIRNITPQAQSDQLASSSKE